MAYNLTIIGAQINITVGDLVGNTRKVIERMRNSSSDVDLLVFPELTLTGYPPLDLVHRPNFIVEQDACLAQVIEESKASINMHVVLGVVTKTHNGNGLHNSLVVINQGRVLLTYHKQLLPTYNIFDEARIFTPGPKVNPVLNIAGYKVGFFICEDLWGGPLYGHRDLVREVLESAPKGLITRKRKRAMDLVVSINASPGDLNKFNTRTEAISRVARDNHIPVFYVNMVGGNDDQIYDGASFAVGRHGVLFTSCESFREDSMRVSFDGCFYLRSGEPDTKALSIPGFAGPSKPDHVIAAVAYYESYREAYSHALLTTAIRDYVHKCGFKRVTVSLSGGIDSALVTLLCVNALGPANVECVTMPAKFSSEGSVSDSQVLCDTVGVKLTTLPIQESVDAQLAAYEAAFGEPMGKLAQENLQAATRGNLIMRRSNSEGTLVMSCGNKSELCVGFFTVFGDSNGAMAPIGDLYKTEVRALYKWLAEAHGVPLTILNKKPSAELSEGQLDTDSLPPYEVLDAIMRLYIEGDLLTATERNEARGVIKQSGVGIDEIKRVVLMTDRNEYKRRVLGVIPRVHARAFGAGRRLPVAQGTPFLDDMWRYL